MSHCEIMLPSSVGEFRTRVAAGQPILAFEILAMAAPDLKSLTDAMAQGRFDAALHAFDAYQRKMLLLHDLLVELVANYPTIMRLVAGQKASEEILREAFSTCVFYEELWHVVKSLKNEENAAFLAEHFRAHFSGEKRDGTVQVVEESDRFRLIFKPCGSGGAMRARASARTASTEAPLMTEASPQSWQKKNKVPDYCSHCAINELESVKRIGYPLFVTEFNPDPKRPCGWTLFKDPNTIPEEHFTRIGARKDPSKFVKTGK